MAATDLSTGNTTTITFASALTVKFDLLNLGEETRESLETSDLTTTNFMTFIPGDLRDAGQLEGNFYWYKSDTAFPSAGGAAQLVTITFPTTGAETVGATFTATGFITVVGRPEVANNQVMKGRLVFKFDGDTTEPTYTVAS